MNRFCALSIAILTGTAFGLALCINSIYIFGLLFFLPFIWLKFKTRTQATLFIMAFYFAAAWEIVPGFINHYTWNSILYAISLWCAAGFIPAIPWCICYPRQKHRLRSILISVSGLLILLTLPPFGVIIWANPLTSAGLIYPTLGLWGFLLCFILINSLAVSLFAKRYRWPAIVLSAILLAIGILAQFKDKAVSPPVNWIALNTNSHFTEYDSYLTTLVREQIETGKKVIILPENIVHLDTYQDSELWQQLVQNLKANQATLVTGAQIGNGNAKDHQEGVLIIEPHQTHFYETRQPLPIVSWNPFTNRIPAHWFETGVYKVQNDRMGLFVCFEDFLPWITIMTAQGHPDVLVTICNHWWDLPTAIHKQTFIFELWGRLLNKPILIAENL